MLDGSFGILAGRCKVSEKWKRIFCFAFMNTNTLSNPQRRAPSKAFGIPWIGCLETPISLYALNYTRDPSYDLRYIPSLRDIGVSGCLALAEFGASWPQVCRHSAASWKAEVTATWTASASKARALEASSHRSTGSPTNSTSPWAINSKA